MARWWHVVADNRQNEHQEHERSSHVACAKGHEGPWWFVCYHMHLRGLEKIHTENQQIVRAGFAV
jgi:hypothetical protein